MSDTEMKEEENEIEEKEDVDTEEVPVIPTWASLGLDPRILAGIGSLFLLMTYSNICDSIFGLARTDRNSRGSYPDSFERKKYCSKGSNWFW